MGLEIPDLDDRSFEALLTDARKRIAVYSDDWTDHNPTDPGITMLEVLAWVAESNIYELDRVTERHVRKYLRLLGVTPEAPTTATASLSLDPPATAAGKTLPAGSPLTVEHAGEREHFVTTHDHVVTDADVAAVVSETAEGRVDNTPANDGDGLYFLAFGEEALEGRAVYIGFDADPFAGGARLDLHVDFHEANLPDPASHGDHDASFTPSARVVWEYCTDYSAVHDPDNWRRVDAAGADSSEVDRGVVDGTAQLYHGGTVSIPAPSGWSDDPPTAALFDVANPLYWLRACIEEAGHEVPPQVNSFETGVVEAEHRSRRAHVALTRITDGIDPASARARDTGSTTTNAQPGQEFVFPDAPVLDAEIRVGGTKWDAVEDLDVAGPDSQVYVLDHERGVIRFGDGVRGEVPEPDQVVEAAWYEHGGGEDGNVPARADWGFSDIAVMDDTAPGPELDDRLLDVEARLEVEVVARGPAIGGADAETIDAALARLQADRRTPYRGVTKPDYRHLATHTPGLRFGRAAVHVETGDVGEGCADREVVVVVVPYSPPHRTRPEPSAGFLNAVECHLERHRLLTDRVRVVGPTYVGVQVETVIEVESGSAASHTTDAVEDALAAFLDPLGGYDGDGWPFGRPVYRSELYETVEGVEGVDCVRDVGVAARDPGTRIDAGIGVPRTALVDLVDAAVTVAGSDDQCGEWSR